MQDRCEDLVAAESPIQQTSTNGRSF